MIRSKLAFVAEGTSVDLLSHNLTAYNILDQINGAAFPLFIQQVWFAVVLERDATDPPDLQATLRVRVGTDQIAGGPVAIMFAQSLRATIPLRIQGLLIPHHGNLEFQVLSTQDVVLASYSIDVRPIAPLAVPIPA